MKQTFFDHSRPLTDWTLAAFAVCDGKKPPQATAAALEKGVPAVVPGLVHDTLLARELMADPLIGMHCFEGEWVENQQWIYRTRFDFAETLGEKDRAELVFESLDGRAEVFLNGELLALHRNSYRPLVADIAKRVRAKDNELEVRLTMGLDDPLFPKDSTEPDGVSFATEETLGYRPNRGEPWRIFQRKPAFGYGWDWSPRVATIGIAGTVAVRVSRKARIEGLLCSTISCDEKNARVKVCVELEGLHYYASTDAVLEVRLAAPNGDEVAVSRQDVLVRSGFNEVEFYFDLPSPQLWWPRGYGDQPLYAVYTRLDGKDSDAGALSEAETHMGIRTLALQSAGTFGFEINGKRIFCQGGNWIPPDAIYTRISDRRYETLIALAAQAGMNTLRIWGGGNYERDVFYRTCDRLGVLVWQDFMFACAPYPDHLEWFRDEVAQEARYQVRRLASHACLALWCGSNENTWGFCDWWGGKTQRGARLYNDILPRAVRANAPHVPYWTGSPYGGATPNQPGTGSNHFWKEEGATLCPDLPKRINLRGHDLYPSFFISEYGYHGPCSLRETRRYLGSETVDRSSEVWLHHTNTRRYEETLCAAVKGVYGVDMATVANEAYLLYGGLWQGLAYAYSLDAARFRPEGSGAILCLFNEAWGEA